MRRLRWPLAVFLVCLPVALLAIGYDLPWLGARPAPAVPMSVPDGDQELVWLHTSTNGGTWERFVAGVHRAAAGMPGVVVDDAQAFLDQTTDVAEVVLARDGQPGKLRIRWYKIHSEAKTTQWVEALARRDPAPLAIIGGGSSDRARDLARALARQANWKGDRPLLFITTATAEKVHTEGDDAPEAAGQSRDLLAIYENRTFRFCFGNRQMADAMLDFVWQNPKLKPTGAKPNVLYVDWTDDPYSSDLLEQFQDRLPRYLGGAQANFFRWQVPFSIGGYYLPNRAEAEAADSILKELRGTRGERALLVIPTVPAPARRLLRTLCEAAPQLGSELVALNGDGVTVNTILRDGEFAWPVHALPVPLVLFAHSDPLAWDGRELTGPTSTEDVLHNATMLEIIGEAAWRGGLAPSANELAARLRNANPPVFDESGRRRDRTGEYVVLLNPNPLGVGLPDATLEVWKREGKTWRLTRSQPVHQSRAGR